VENVWTLKQHGVRFRLAALSNGRTLEAAMKILVVEDDRAVAQSLQLLLSRYNYAVDIAADGEIALQMAEAFEYHLVLLDVLLPQISGIEVCRQLRKKGFRQPILLLTGQGATQQKAIALNAGADDYVVKPFDNDELVARIQALLRRGITTCEPILTWGHLSLDPNTRRVAYRDQLLVLTPKEYAIAELFLRHQEMVFNARAILDQAWSSLEAPGEEAVRCHIKELRQKLTAVGAPKDLIKTVYRVGYRLNPLYASSTSVQVDQSANLPQVAELHAVNEELRIALEQLQSTQDELQQKNQELEATQNELEQRVADRTAELGQREAFLSSIYEGAEQSIFVVEVTATNDFRYVSFNHSALQSVELSLQEIENKTPEEVFGLELGSLFRQNYERCLQANRSITYEEHFIFHDRPLWTLTTLSPLHNSQGNIDRIIGTVLDISDRKQTEIALQLSEEQRRLALDLTNTATWDWDLATGNVRWSERMFALFGLVPGLVKTTYDRWKQCVHPNDIKHVQGLVQTHLRNQTLYQAEYRVVHPDGSIHWVLSKGHGIYDATGQAVRMIGITMDIDDRKQTEAALRESERQRMQEVQALNETLEQKVQLRTAQLEALNQELDAFASMISHDLQTPLRHITRFVERLQDSLETAPIDNSSRRYLDIIGQAAEQAHRMINDLLEFSRRGKIPLHLTQVSMAQLVQQVRAQLEPETANRPIEWHIEPLPQVQGDLEMLRLVLQNLLSNAVKYTRDRTPARITIGSQTHDHTIVFYVQDNGAGFDKKYQDRLFKLFQRLHSPEEFEGNGVGLANVRRIIHRHGGQVWAEGTVDQGATFYFSLPQSEINP